MAKRSSSITAQLELKGQQQFKSGLRDIESSTRRTGKAVEQAGKSFGSFGGRVSFTEINSALQLTSGAARMAGSAIKGAFNTDLGMEQIAMGLASVSNGAESLATQFEKLKEASQLPGVGFKELATGSMNLQSVGVAAKDSRDVLIELGNALASIGKGKAELDGITTALAQMYGKGKVSAEEINQIAERLPSIRRIAADINTTDPGEFTKGLTEELSKLPRAAGTAKDAIDNLSDAYDQMMASVTGGKVNEGVKSALNQFTNALKPGVSFDERVQSVGRGIRIPFTQNQGKSPFEKYELSPEQSEKRRKEKEAGDKAEEDRKQKLLQTEINIAEAERNREAAQVANDQKGLRTAEEELAILKEKKKVMEAFGVSEERAIAHIKERVAIENESRNMSRDADAQKRQASFSRELSESEARASGMSGRRFKKLQKDNALAAETENLISEGIDPKDAKTMAERKVNAESRIAENEDRASRGLRPRIRTITDKAETNRNRFNRMSSADRARLENLSSDENAEETYMRKQRGGIDAHAGDAAMSVRPRESNLPRRIQGAGRREDIKKDQQAPGDKSGIGEQLAQLIKETQAVRTAVEKTAPGSNERSKPISSTNR